MPNLKILNPDENGDAEIENGAQQNKIESITIGTEELSISDKNIKIELASQEDVQALFEGGEE